MCLRILRQESTFADKSHEREARRREKWSVVLENADVDSWWRRREREKSYLCIIYFFRLPLDFSFLFCFPSHNLTIWDWWRKIEWILGAFLREIISLVVDVGMKIMKSDNKLTRTLKAELHESSLSVIFHHVFCQLFIPCALSSMT